MFQVKRRHISWVLVGIFCFFSFYPPISSGSPSVLCSSEEVCYREFLDSLISHPLSADQNRFFDFLQSNYPESPWAKRANIRRGYELKDSFPGTALTYLRQGADEFPPIADYLNFWMGEAYERLENWQEAARAFLKVSAMDSESLLAREGRYRAGLMLVESHDCPKALNILASALAALPNSSHAPAALWAMANCAIEQGQLDEGQKLLRELWWHYPQSREGRESEKWLDRELGGEGFVPSSAERYQRAMAFYSAGLLEEAVGEFGRFLSEDSSGPQFFHAQYQLGVALARLKRYPDAEGMFKRLVRSDSSRTDDAWVWLGRVYLRQGKGEALGQLVRELPSEVLAGDQQALIWIFYGIWLEDHDRWGEANDAYARAATLAHLLSQRVDGLWRVGWLTYQREQYAEAARIFEKIVKAVPQPDSDSLVQTVSQAVYWWARSEQQLNQEESAAQRFQELASEFPYTYYGQLAGHRVLNRQVQSPSLPVLAGETLKSQEVPIPLLEDSHFGKVQELHELGLFSEAALEMQELYRRYGGQPQAFQFLVALAVRVKAYDLGIRLTIRHFGEKLRKGKLPRTSEAWLGAFPTGYQNLIQEVAPQDVDPYLVAGLIREESLYNPRARSGVGAMGLMQLMPATAKRVAHQVGMPVWEEDSEALFHPERNIRLGSSYLGGLINDFQGNLVYAIASYNAGPSAVKRWIGRHGQRPLDEFVELIGYRETRGYVKRVLGSYWIYRTVFSEGCARVSLDTFC